MKLLLVFVFIYFMLTVALHFVQEKMIFFPSKLANDFQFHLDVPFEEQWLTVDGTRIHSLVVRHPGKSKGVLVYFHGNAGSLNGWDEVAELIVKREPWDVWILDYPGYGKSDGTISSESQLDQIASAFLTEAKKKLSPNQKLVVYGRSIGTGPATTAARTKTVDGLILETPFLSFRQLATDLYSWSRIFPIKYAFRSDRAIAQVKCPILILHGDQDEVIPTHHGERLARVNSKAQFRLVHGASHNNLAGFPEYWKSLGEFLGSI